MVDDQAPFRAAAKAVLRRLEGFELAGEAATGVEAVQLADEIEPALVLMDINMPQMDGIEATRQIVAAHPGVVVILCSTYAASDLPPAARVSGAAGVRQQGRAQRRRGARGVGPPGRRLAGGLRPRPPA